MALTPERGKERSVTAEELIDRLRSRLRAEGRLVVAYSGGIDSALLAKVVSGSTVSSPST